MAVEQKKSLGSLWLCLAFLPVLLAAVSSLAASELAPLTDQSDRPALLFSTYLRHHGMQPVPFGRSLMTDFVFVNTGSSPVKIENVERSCSCMAPRLSSQEIPPGEQGFLQVPISTLNERPGMHEYQLNVSYSDPKPRKVTLRIKAVMPEQSVVLTPRAIMMSQRTPKPFPLTPIVVNDYRETPLQINSVFSTAPFVQVTTAGNDSTIQQVAHQVDGEAAGFQLTIGGEVEGSIPPGRHHGLIIAETNDQKHPALTVPIVLDGPKYEPGQEPFVSPAQVRFYAMAERLNAQASVIDLQVPLDWTIDAADCWPEQVELQYSEPEPLGKHHQLVQVKVNITELPPRNVQNGIIQVSFNGGKNLVTTKVNFIWP